MPVISFQKPTDQPTKTKRLLEEFKLNLTSPSFKEFRIVVAFAKKGPLLKLKNIFQAWLSAGKKIYAIFGIDECGTSYQALNFAHSLFSEVYIAHLPKGLFNPTFHPKFYMFSGETKAIAYLGSNNFTTGGLETNFESHVKFELNLPSEKPLFDDLSSYWSDAKKISRLLDSSFLAELKENDLLMDEERSRKVSTEQKATKAATKNSLNFPTIQIFPPSAIPKDVVTPPREKTLVKKAEKTSTSLPQGVFQALIIQIVPHHNGEVFLSKIAVDQNQEFFGFPFSGRTMPKNPSNPSYPQLLPDPIVNITVFDKTGRKVFSHDNFPLNTVYYEKKSEIRITVPSDVVKLCPEYSIMMMKRANIGSEDYDYDIEIYIPGSTSYSNFLPICNQTMPSGGRSQARMFGWL